MVKVEIYTMELGKILEVKVDEVVIPVLDITKESGEVLKSAQKFFEIFDIKNARNVQDKKHTKQILVTRPVGYEKWDIKYEKPITSVFGVGLYNLVIVKLREHFGHREFKTCEVIDLFEKHLRGKRGTYERKTLGKVASAYLTYLVKNGKAIKLRFAKYQFVFVKPNDVDKALLDKIKEQEREVRREIA